MLGDEIGRGLVAASEQECQPSAIAGDTTAGIPPTGAADQARVTAGAEAGKPSGAPHISPDWTVSPAAGASGDAGFAALATRLKMAHDAIAHSRGGGPISDAPGPLHSNLDRLWATWLRNSC